MKRVILFGLLALCTTGIIAQKEGSFLALGLKAGFNSTKFKLSDLGNYTTEQWKTETMVS